MVTIKKIALNNFKGWSRAEQVFDGNMELRAGTGVGKTTYFDAWRWVLGFNVSDIEPISKGNVQIPDLKTEVEIAIGVDGIEYVLKRVSEQQWKTDKLTQTKSFNGNLTTFFIDGFETKATLYKEKIADLFGLDSYDNLELLTNLAYFNTNNGTKWDWRARRQFLFNACGINGLVQGILDDEKYNLIANDLKKGYSTIDITKQLNTEKKGINEAKTKNEILLNSKAEELAEANKLDFGWIESEISKLTTKLESTIQKSGKSGKSEILTEKSNELTKMMNELTKLNTSYAKQESEFTAKKQSAYRELRNIAVQIDENNDTIKNIEALRDKACDNPIDENCSLCGQKLPESEIETVKAKRDEAIQSYTESIEALADTNTKLKKEYNKKKNIYDNMVFELDKTEAEKLATSIDYLQDEITNMKVADSNAELEAKANELREEIAELQKQMAYKDIVANLKASMEALRLDNIEQTNREVKVEQKRQQLENYVLETIGLVSGKINSFFDGVEFRLFDTLTANANKDIQEVCEVEYDGIGYGSLSNGQKIMANFLTVKGLQKIFNVNLPIFVDEAQSITLNLEAEQQLIKLVTSKETNIAGTRIKDLF